MNDPLKFDDEYEEVVSAIPNVYVSEVDTDDPVLVADVVVWLDVEDDVDDDVPVASVTVPLM